MTASLRSELLKLRKRPSTWILGAILIFVVVFFDYFQFYSSVASLEEGGNDPTGQITNVEEFKQYLLPGSFTVNVPGLLSQFGGPVALILGALAAGSEYGWGTVKTALTQGLGRLKVLSSKLLAVGIVLAVFTVLVLGTGAIASYVVAGLLEESVEWPAVGNILQAFGVTWLIFGAWASLGIFLAMLFRSTALAIGLGLVWGLVVENLIFGFAQQSEIIDALTNILLITNGGTLANSLGDPPQAFTAPDPAEPSQTLIVLLVYLVGLLLVSILLFRQRDVA
jgi:ABC-type transport system involved in multi-copper enzyme maturation permease subunit